MCSVCRYHGKERERGFSSFSINFTLNVQSLAVRSRIMFIRRSHSAEEMEFSSPICWKSLHARFTWFDDFCFNKSMSSHPVGVSCSLMWYLPTHLETTLSLTQSFRRRSQKNLTSVSSGGGKHPDLSLLLLLLMLECLTVAAF